MTDKNLSLDETKKQSIDDMEEQSPDHVEEQSLDPKKQSLDNKKERSLDHTEDQSPDQTEDQSPDHMEEQPIDHTKKQSLDHKEESLDQTSRPSVNKSSTERDHQSGSISLQARSDGSLSEGESSTHTEINPLKDVVIFDYSFGYDCNQHFNLCVADEDTLLYFSGSLIHFFNVKSKTLNFVRSLSGNGIGHIVKNHIYNHIAVGEKGPDPLIIIHEWPSFNIVSKLIGGTTYAYSYLGYSPDGDMLVSQGKEPDHQITVWNWRNATIILRTKSHGQDVYNAQFSQFDTRQLVSSGLGHIKFWKMAKTFTGLKLQGELGRFGKTEICDIVGVCVMPDEKVVSGSEWGDLLIWEDRLIKMEIRQKSKGNCHNAAISQILYNAETMDIISVGLDGWIKLWARSTIDFAVPPDEEEWYLEMQPHFELQVKDDFNVASIMSLCKKNIDPADRDWFAQDRNGGIWAVRLFDGNLKPEKLLTCHASAVADMVPSSFGHYLATLGINGCLLIHNVISRQLLITKQFAAPGTSLIWLPLHVEASGTVLVGGFSDGMIRMFVANIHGLQSSRISSSSSLEYLNIIQKVKAHSGAVTVVSHNPRGSILVSGGMDSTIFVFQIMPKTEYIELIPIGFVNVPNPVCFITWRPQEDAVAIVACIDGSIVKVKLPEKVSSDVGKTYELDIPKELIRFRSVKSEIIRAQEEEELEKEKKIKLDRKLLELARVKEENPDINVDEERFLADSQEEFEFPPLYYPEVPNPVLFIMQLPNGNFYLSVDGYDSGYLYEFSFDSPTPIAHYPIPDAFSIPAHCFLPICGGQAMVLGMASGFIRIVQCEDGYPVLSTYYEFPMHDLDHGHVNRLCMSADKLYLFSCGTDGNVFSYRINDGALKGQEDDKLLARSMSLQVLSPAGPTEVVPDSSGDAEHSLEEIKMKAEHLRQMVLSNERKENVRQKLQKLSEQFMSILYRHSMLPSSQALPHSVFELDPRITEGLESKLNEEMALLQRRMAFRVAKSRLLSKKMFDYFVDKIACLDVTVRAIKNEDLRIKAFTHNKLESDFLKAERDMKRLFHMMTCISQMTLDESSRYCSSMTPVPRRSAIESYLKVQLYYHKMPLKARKAFIKLNSMRLRKDQRKNMWNIFLETKPNIHEDDQDDLLQYKEAERTIGDLKLKMSDTYKVPEENKITPAKKYTQLLALHREIYVTKEVFNKKVCDIRDTKVTLVRKFKQYYHDLDIIQREIPPFLRKERLPIPRCWLKNNFPEHIFKLEFGADPTAYTPISGPYDEEFYVLKVTESDPVSVHNAETDAVAYWHPSFSLEKLQSMGADDNQDTVWEYELKIQRMIRLLHEQDLIIDQMKSEVDEFDDLLETLSIDRLTYARDIKVMEIFKLTLYQELVVINSYASQEDEISQRINIAVAKRNDKMQQKITIQEAVDAKSLDISLWQVKLTNLHEELNEKLVDNKFAAFLSRIFKRKKSIARSDDESESESSSSDETMEEEYDEDDEDYIPVKLDENVCPEGCDPQLFESTLNSRKLRYEIEDNIAELHKQIDEQQREIQICVKDLTQLDHDVAVITQELEAVQFEKQQKLNEIETVVVMNLSQCRHFKSASHPEEGLVHDPLVVHDDELLKLAGRKHVLELETQLEETKTEQQKRLMQRLNKKRKEMKEIKKSLKKEIDEEILSKFGTLLNVELLEESVLKKMINEARRNYQVDNLRQKYDVMIASTKKELQKHIEDFIEIEKENTRRLRVQAVLDHEGVNLNMLMRKISINKEKLLTVTEEEAYEEDIKKLEKILKEQLETKEKLQKEINLLRYKCTPPNEKRMPEVALTSKCNKMEEVNLFKVVDEEEIKSVDGQRSEDTSEAVLVERTVLNEDKSAVNIFPVIDEALYQLASSSSAHDVANSLVKELIRSSVVEEKSQSSALDCALKLVEELLLITTKENEGDIELVEHYAKELLSKSQEGDLDEELKD